MDDCSGVKRPRGIREIPDQLKVTDKHTTRTCGGLLSFTLLLPQHSCDAAHALAAQYCLVLAVDYCLMLITVSVRQALLTDSEEQKSQKKKKIKVSNPLWNSC